MRFIRNQPWLRNVFPASELPREGPNLISDDVQFTADYFGGGYAIREPQAWFSTATVTKAASDSLVLVDVMPADQTVRLMKASIMRGVAGPQVAALQACLVLGSPDAAQSVALGNPYTNLILAGASATFRNEINIGYQINIPGLSRLYIYFFAGDNIDYLVQFLSIAVPRGVAIGP